MVESNSGSSLQRSTSKGDMVTLFVFLSLFGILMVYDIWTLTRRGYNTTVSWTIYQLARGWPAVPFAFGFLMGHLFFPQKPEVDSSHSA